MDGRLIRAARDVRQVVKVGDKLVDADEFKEKVEELKAAGYISVSFGPNRRVRRRNGEMKASAPVPQVFVDVAAHPGGEAEKRRRRNRRKAKRRKERERR